MAGEIAKVTGSGMAMPSTTFAVLDVGSITSDPDNILTETSSGVYRPDAAGQYLILVRSEFESTHNNRQNIRQKIQVNDADYAGAWTSGYGRNNGNDFQWHWAKLIGNFDGSTDDFRVMHQRDAGAGSPAGTYNASSIIVVRLSDSEDELPWGHYGTPTTQSSHTNSWTKVAGWDVITESDTSVIELQAGGEDIELKEADRPYLFVYAMVNSDSGAGRTHRMARATHNSDPIHHSLAYEYQRNAADQHAIPAGMGIVRPASANQDLDFEIIGYTGTHWGVWDAGSWALSAASGEAGVMVIALPADTDMAVFEDETANQNVQGATNPDINHSRTTVGTADSPFTRDNNTDVTVSSSTDILAFASVGIRRDTANGTRWNKAIRWEIEGVDNTESRGGNYERGDQTSDDCLNAALNCCYVGAVSANDTFQVEMYTPAGQDTGGGTMETEFAGSFFIDLASFGHRRHTRVCNPRGDCQVVWRRIRHPRRSGGNNPAATARSFTVETVTPVGAAVTTPAAVARSFTIPAVTTANTDSAAVDLVFPHLHRPGQDCSDATPDIHCHNTYCWWRHTRHRYTGSYRPHVYGRRGRCSRCRRSHSRYYGTNVYG